jgi:hypothetical protein
MARPLVAGLPLLLYQLLLLHVLQYTSGLAYVGTAAAATASAELAATLLVLLGKLLLFILLV